MNGFYIFYPDRDCFPQKRKQITRYMSVKSLYKKGNGIVCESGQ